MKLYRKSHAIMKNIIGIFILAIAITSCGGNDAAQSVDSVLESNNLSALKLEKAKQRGKMDSINNILVQLSDKIALLDTLQENPLVKVMQAKDTIFTHYIELQGNITTDENVLVGPESSGILTLYVKEGQNVSRGAVIGTIKDRGIKDQLNQAQIQVGVAQSQLKQAQIQSDLSKVTFQKQASLWKQKIGSEIQYIQAQTNYNASLKQVDIARQQVSSAKKGVANVRAQLGRNNIVAPFSGVVEEIITKSGQNTMPGSQIIRLVALHDLKAEVSVPEVYLANIKPGTAAEVTLPALNQVVPSNVRRVANYINPDNRSFIVEIPVSNPNGIIKPNLIAKVKMADYQKNNTQIVPKKAIKRGIDKKDYVFKVININGNQGTAKKVPIIKGLSNNDGTEIKSGINNGDIIVTEGIQNIEDGQKIIIN